MTKNNLWKTTGGYIELTVKIIQMIFNKIPQNFLKYHFISTYKGTLLYTLPVLSIMGPNTNFT